MDVLLFHLSTLKVHIKIKSLFDIPNWRSLTLTEYFICSRIILTTIFLYHCKMKIIVECKLNYYLIKIYCIMMQLDLFSKFHSNCQSNKLILFDICAIFLCCNYLIFIYGANVSTKHCHWSLPIPKWLISLITINTTVNETRHVCIDENKNRY